MDGKPPKTSPVERIAAAYDKKTCSTAKQIGEVLGITRNAVIGYYSRNPSLKLQYPLQGQKHGGKKPGAAARVPRGRNSSLAGFAGEFLKERIERRRTEVLTALPVVATEDVGRYTLLKLPPRCCKWPVGEQPMLFCGEPSDFGEPYCAVHRRRAINPLLRIRGRTRSL